MSKAHGLQFSAAMVRAILDGSKTMTRRKPSKNGPRFKAGDTIWVREGCYTTMAPRFDVGTSYVLKADKEAYWHRVEYIADGAKPTSDAKKYSSRTMPRWASRITLVVTESRVERLHDISESDAKAEGAGCCLWFQPNKNDDSEDLNLSADAIGLVHPSHGGADGISYRNGFANLWESIHGAGSWDENPEVEVISFEVVK